MQRNLETYLNSWKSSPKRNPLLVLGARQVGKTFLLENFGREQFSKSFLFDFSQDRELHTIFDKNLDVKKIISDLSIKKNVDIDANRDLVILDEIQECPRALTALKYLNKEIPNGFIAATGSLLGVSLGVGESFPVGNVDRVFLRPMNFEEFLLALDEKKLHEIIAHYEKPSDITALAHGRLMDLLKYYLVTGGMPEIVAAFASSRKQLNGAFTQVRRLQKNLVDDYLGDFTKYSGNIKSIRIAQTYRSIPSQLAHAVDGSSNKFVFNKVLSHEKSNFESLAGPIEWLKSAGLIHQVPICNHVAVPLQGVSKQNQFKLYLSDVGILGQMASLPPSSIYSSDYGTYKGYFIENFVLQELIAKHEKEVFSWGENTSEIEFLMESGGEILPIEVKSGKNAKAKSLGVYRRKYHPKKSVLISTLPPEQRSGLLQLPLYLAHKAIVMTD